MKNCIHVQIKTRLVSENVSWHLVKIFFIVLPVVYGCETCSECTMKKCIHAQIKNRLILGDVNEHFVEIIFFINLPVVHGCETYSN